jgi:hypothetical protein
LTIDEIQGWNNQEIALFIFDMMCYSSTLFISQIEMISFNGNARVVKIYLNGMWWVMIIWETSISEFVRSSLLFPPSININKAIKNAWHVYFKNKKNFIHVASCENLSNTISILSVVSTHFTHIECSESMKFILIISSCRLSFMKDEKKN